MERKWQTAVVWMLVSVVLGLLSILAVPWVTITGLVSTDVMAPTVIKAFRGLDDHKLWSFIIAWGCYPILAIAMWVIAQVWNSDDLDSSRRGSIRVGAWLVAAWTALAAIRTWGSLHPLSVLSTEGNYVTFQMRAQAGVWLALGSAACLVVAAMVRTSSNGLMAVPAPALRPILPLRHVTAATENLRSSPSYMSATPAAPIRPQLPKLEPRPAYVPTANPHRTGWVVLSVLVFAAIIAGMIARTRSSDPQAESVRTSPSTTVQIPTSVEVLIARVAAPLPPPTTVAPATTVSDGQRTDVALYVAQSLATAFATADWPTARTVSPQNPVWTDDKYALGFEGLQASYLSVAGSRLSGNTVDLWMTEVASELRAGRKRTAIYCVHWMYSEDSRTSQGIAGKTVRTVNGFQDASITTPADVDACKQFDGP